MSPAVLCPQCGLPVAIGATDGPVCRCVLQFATVTAMRPAAGSVATLAPPEAPEFPAAPPPPLRFRAVEPAPPAPPGPPADPAATAAAAAPASDQGWNVRPQRAAPTRSWDTPPAASLALHPPMATPWPAAGAGTAGQPATRPRRTALRAAALAVALVVAGLAYAAVARGGVGNLFGSGKSLSQPSSIGSLGLLTTPDTAAATAAMRSGLAKNAQQTVAAVYGTDGTPQLVFAAAKGGTQETSDQIIQELSGAGLGFDSASAITPILDGQQFECGSIGGQGSPGGVMCAWNDSDIDAVVLNLGSSDLQATATLAAQARAAAEH